MELKDVILSTIAELGDEERLQVPFAEKKERGEIESDSGVSEVESWKDPGLSIHSSDGDFIKEERLFLEHMRERILVLFEGFQSPNNKRVEAKIDLTLNFLEYLLAILDERIESLKKT
jgi:hypothetical protein